MFYSSSPSLLKHHWRYSKLFHSPCHWIHIHGRQADYRKSSKLAYPCFRNWGLEDSSILKRLLVSLPGAALNRKSPCMVGKHPRNPCPQFVGCFNEATVSSGFLWKKRRWELIVTFCFQVLCTTLGGVWLQRVCFACFGRGVWFVFVHFTM